MSQLDSPEALERELRQIGADRYHDKHPFHQMLNDGKLNKDQVTAWALNRYYYQARIPIKDAIILARLDDPALRREWRQRIIDHDGDGPDQGGIERWLKLTDSLGLDREYVVSLRGLLPGTRYAVDAYAQFVGTKSILEAIASSLTELFAPQLIATRVSGMLASYDFVSPQTLAYFDKRLTQAPRDSDFALDYCKQHATTPALREKVCEALRFKCNLLWAQLDALHYAYVEPGHIPPGAYDPSKS